ncbi:MAG: Acyl-CoA:1-acyl-sn-glycerol-3-phosphate acyltransferase [uncultured Rubrobacteraceae bacterium]|uniref:Acyl-CoA:1-acyl-sn-glycerol-3-phosphate acyltransferase n=1 Tax=uncultured Rubrobacteraceae bacterium TaxID=349277 RepID=A0A6J4PZQ9_9ACTN|nr:MAG: Acyl-CoA:1-acyl-sn-glycerol-3-phosphate acyltransferase [uncultured Rubrobacteraceae bacterium]
MEAGRLEKGLSRGMSSRYRLFRRTVILLGRVLFGFTVHGAEKVPKEGPLIIASNHRRYADPVLVSMAVPRRIQWMAKKELFISPFDRLFFFIGAFPIDRQRGARAALKTSLDLLAANWALGIFPEGTRRKSYDPEDAPKSGIAMISARSNAPILPVFVGAVPNPLQRLKNSKLEVYVGDPIFTHNTKSPSDDRRERREVAGRILREIYALGEGSKMGERS